MTEERIMPPEGFVVEDCRVNESGHCALHGIEIERRKSTQRDVQALKEEHGILKAEISALKTFKDNVQGGTRWGGVLLMIILLGSYTYIYNHIQDAGRAAEHQQVSNALATEERKQLTTAMNVLKIDLGRSDERAVATNSRLSSIDGRLAQIVGLLLSTGKISTGDVMDMYNDKKQ